MRCFSCVMFAVCLFNASTANAGPSPSDFRFIATVDGKSSPNEPISIPLSREIILEAKHNFVDVRVFDDTGLETPYVIYKQTQAHETPKSYVFEIVSYDNIEGSDEFLLKRPPGAPSIREIELQIAGKDFKKRIQVEAGLSPQAMKEIAANTIFDFSSRLTLRKTTVHIPETNADFLRLRLTDESPPPAESPEMRLRYEGLEFWTDGHITGPFHVNRILGWSGQRKPSEIYLDYITIENPVVSIDAHGNSLIDLGCKLPLAQITFDIENPYYYRRVQLLTAIENVDEQFRVVAGGVIYKIPGIEESENTIHFDQPTRYLRLHVPNDDNPPLRVRSITIAWVRRNLYFVPEPGRSYTLHVGSEVVSSPRYELSHLIPSDFAKLKHYASMSVQTLRPNASYAPRAIPVTNDDVEKKLFTGLVIILVCALSIWAFRLLKKMPYEAGE